MSLQRGSYIYCADYRGLTHNLLLVSQESSCDTATVMDTLGRTFQYCLEEDDIIYDTEDENYGFIRETFISYVKQNLEDVKVFELSSYM